MKSELNVWPEEIVKPKSFYQGEIKAPEKPIGIIISLFNLSIGARLLDGARDVLDSHDASYEIAYVPGALELPLAAQKMAQTHRFAAIICLGAVIRGDTPHFDYVCSESAHGLTQVSLLESLPVIFGVLTTDTVDQALERSEKGEDNKGAYAAQAALETSHLSFISPMTALND